MGEFLELRVINVGPVDGQYVPVYIIRGLEHETVVDGLYLRGHAFVGMDDGVHFYAAFLPARPRMATRSFENEVGKQRYRGGTDDLQAVEPGGNLPSRLSEKSSPLYPHTFSGLRMLASDNVLRRGSIPIPKRASLRASGNIEPVISRKESKTPDYSIEHHGQVLPNIKVFHVAFAAVFVTGFIS